MGGTPLPPLTENHPAQKPSAEMGGIPPPLPVKSVKYFLTGSLTLKKNRQIDSEIHVYLYSYTDICVVLATVAKTVTEG